MQKISVLMFHPRFESSRVNKFIFENIRSMEMIKVKDMYELYPDFNIDIKKEQSDLLDADIIIIQHPFFWYSAPPLVKQWLDLVLEHGWAYGREGNKLKGKKIMHIISSGGSFQAYCSQGRNQYTYVELLRPFELSYKLCGMDQLPSYIVTNANSIQTEELEKHGIYIKKLITKLGASALFDIDFQKIAYMNDLN